MNIANHDDSMLQADIANWLATELGVRRERISLATLVNDELGVAGSDGVDMMLALGRRYGVDLSEFPFAKHFGGESSINPLTILLQVGRLLMGQRSNSLEPLSVADLVRLVADAKSSSAEQMERSKGPN